MFRQSGTHAVEAVFSIAYTDNMYIYFRHFSTPSLDSLPIVCYKPAMYSRSVGKVYEGRPLQDAGLSPLSVSSFKP
jgi:hypothetical protein